MIVHVLVGKTGDELDDTGIRELKDALTALGQVPGVLELTWGPDFSGRGKGYTHAAVLKFASHETLQSYLTHETHRQIVKTIDRLMPDRLVLDYETGTSGIST